MEDDLADDSVAVLSDVDEEDAAAASVDPLPSTSAITADQIRIRDLLSQLDQERSSRQEAEAALKRRDESINRLRAFAQDCIKKRDDAVKEKDEALKEKDEIWKQKEALKSEMDHAAQMMATGIDKISNKISNFKNFDVGLPRSQKYATGLPAVAYGVIKRSNEIVEELVKQIDGVTKSRDHAREQIEQRNYEIAIEVSQLEASIGELKDEVLKKDKEIERLEGLVGERDGRISEMEGVVLEREERLRGLEEKMDSMRPLIIDELRNVSKVFDKLNKIVRIADGGLVDSDSDLDSSFVWEEMDIEVNLRALAKGMVSIYEDSKVAVEKVRSVMEEKRKEIGELKEKVDGLLAEKQYIGTLLRSALRSKTNEVLQVAEDGLREAGIDLRFDGHEKTGVKHGEVDEVYTLAGALENTLKESQLEIIELKHLVDALRAESSLLKAHLDAQAKEISLQKQQIKELEQKEHLANESVEGLMLDIAAAEEEIARWKVAAEQEAAAGRAIEQEFLAQLSTLRQELDETKQAMSELENKLKFKEETAAAAIAARDAAENSLRLADLRSARLRERVDELSRQIEDADNGASLRNSQSNHRYVCWPWQWLGINLVRQPDDVQESSNEMELSEPLI